MKTMDFSEVSIWEGHSQKEQHCYISFIFDHIGVTNKHYVDIGAYNGVVNSNVFDLRVKEGWDGLMIDNHEENSELNLHKHSVDAENICDILSQHDTPENFDLLSLDIDGMDYWVLKSLLTQYKPRVLVVESNVRFSPSESRVLKYNPSYFWDGLNWYGASPLAFKKLVNSHDYSPVFVLNDDIFIVHNSCLSQEQIDFPWEKIYSSSNKDLYKDHVKSYHPNPVEFPVEEEWIDV